MRQRRLSNPPASIYLGAAFHSFEYMDFPVWQRTWSAFSQVKHFGSAGRPAPTLGDPFRSFPSLHSTAEVSTNQPVTKPTNRGSHTATPPHRHFLYKLVYKSVNIILFFAIQPRLMSVFKLTIVRYCFCQHTFPVLIFYLIKYLIII